MQTEFKKILLKQYNKDTPGVDDKQKHLNTVLNYKQNYLNAPNQNARNSIISDLGTYSKNVIKVEEFKMDAVSTFLNEDIVGKNIEQKLGKPMTQFFGSALDGTLPYEIINDEAVYNVPNINNPNDLTPNYKSLYELQDYIDSTKIDLDSKDQLNAMITNSSIEASNLKPGQSIDFNYKKHKLNIKNNILPNADLNSLINDEIFGGRTFKNDLVESIMEATYADLGIALSKEEIKSLDPTNDGKVSFADAMVIFNKLMSDKEKVEDYLADYYTKFMEQNFNNSISKEVIQSQNKKENGYNPYEFA
tara:strand:- start:785 stop:1699 length:915 start_codon:yes stop_codon:yes gene_type:complete